MPEVAEAFDEAFRLMHSRDSITGAHVVLVVRKESI
jgi:hypothetical protein